MEDVRTFKNMEGVRFLVEETPRFDTMYVKLGEINDPETRPEAYRQLGWELKKRVKKDWPYGAVRAAAHGVFLLYQCPKSSHPSNAKGIFGTFMKHASWESGVETNLRLLSVGGLVKLDLYLDDEKKGDAPPPAAKRGERPPANKK